MTKDEHIQFWVEDSESDLTTAKSMFQSKHFNWSLFVAHLALEKLLKALWIKNNKSNTPPKIHNLLKLAEGAGLSLSEEEKQLLAEANEFQIETRYAQFKLEFYKKCTPAFTKSYLNQMEGFYRAYRTKCD
ncbi:MAG: HEPN domain-containing protein [Bacteroidetes bacterium]|nr:HEPN domain-containing protein [Bacteroidota bacterium]MCW5895596.1 HEPN domain-containing protein [Bacteroidota bacterium]